MKVVLKKENLEILLILVKIEIYEIDYTQNYTRFR